MNIVQKLTLRHIRTHMKRSVLTALAIAVSVAMVTAVFTTVTSFLKYEHDTTVETGGSWHAQYMFDKTPDLSVFENESQLTCVAVGRSYCELITNGAGSRRAPGTVDAANAETQELRSIRILEGTFPTSARELLISDRFLEVNELDWRVGDTVRVSAIRDPYENETQTECEFLLCGIADDNCTYFDNRAGLVLYDGTVPVDAHTYVTVRFDTLDSGIYDRANALAEKCGSNSAKMNVDLFAFSGVFRHSGMLRALVLFVSIILAIIVIASVSMIYDSFAVSYQERERYLGMLASVGATKKQKRASIYFEGLILALIAIPVGIGAGFLGMEITFRGIQTQLLYLLGARTAASFRVRFSPWIVLGDVAVAALTVFVSCYIPARRASKTSPIDAIRGANTVRVKKAKRLRVSRLERRLFGCEGELAVKNYKRNGRRSRNIVFALVLSAVLFLSVSNFSTLLDELIVSETGGRQADFTVGFSAADIEKAEPILKNGIGADSAFGYAGMTMSLRDDALLTEEARKINGQAEDADIMLEVAGVDRETFDGFVRRLGGTAADYHEKDKIRAVVMNTALDTSVKELTPYEFFSDAAVGAALHLNGLEDTEPQSEGDVTVGLLTGSDYGADLPVTFGATLPVLILPFDTFYEIADAENGYVLYGVKAKNYEEVEDDANVLLNEAGVRELSFYDNGASVRQMNALFDVVKVFIYGFITLITLIAVINIVNSVANSMNERKREFAMLRSVGLTPGGFKKMVWAESIRYGVKSLLIALPLGLAINFGMYYSLAATDNIDVRFAPNPLFYVSAVLGVIAIIVVSLLYSADKLKDDGIIENLKEDI
ncbi:MAG: ABC transporter permease [Clostridia bacterium]|nr:ABC transporter permease [Clostridia bacterium]